MGRKKCPEETKKLILDVSLALFMQKGYDNTSLQDIMTETKISKGGIYHHFASKEDIFDEIGNRSAQKDLNRLYKVRDSKTLNGAQKLQEMFRVSVLNKTDAALVNICPSLLDNPKFLAFVIRDGQNITVPKLLMPIIEEGINDGSIKASNPKELAEAIVVLTSIWLNPLIYDLTKESIIRKCQVFNTLVSSYGIELFDEEMIRKMGEYLSELT